MKLNQDICYNALIACDPRFDGLFFVGVSSTGIYCRSVCPARKPHRDKCTFFPNAASAERDGYRPCLRCRPELAPSQSPFDSSKAIVPGIISRIQAGALNICSNVESLAAEFELSSRQIRRLMRQEAGVTPIEYAQTCRLLLAKAADRLIALPGIGSWTSSYIAMRALRWPDAFLESDLGIKHALKETSPSKIRKIAEPWRPFRSYATMHLWADLS